MKESQPLSVTHVLQAEILNYPQEITLSGMHLKQPCSVGFTPESRIPEDSICPLEDIALNPPPKGLVCPFFQELKRDSSFVSEHHGPGWHSLQSLPHGV